MHKNILLAIIFTVSICFLSCTKENSIENTNSEFFTVQYKTDDSIFPNPERGLYTHRGYESSSKPITANELKRLHQDNITLVFTSYHLKDFITQPIGNNMLKLIQDNFDALRANGMKAVLRFAYSKSSDALIYDADQHIALTHISQLKPL